MQVPWVDCLTEVGGKRADGLQWWAGYGSLAVVLVGNVSVCAVVSVEGGRGAKGAKEEWLDAC